jgi:cell wall-associated NlpC family hydrolase
MVLAGLLSLLLTMPVNAPAVHTALSLIGSPYRFGGNGERGYDCAGLVRTAYAASGIRLPRTTTALFSAGLPISRDELRPGDLVFFRNTYRRGISHVGIYVGSGRFVHAPSRGGRVRTDVLHSAYYASRFAVARRVQAGPES